MPDFLTAGCIVSMFAIVGYAMGPKPAQQNLDVMGRKAKPEPKKSEALPWAERPESLVGTSFVGDSGFDPLGLFGADPLKLGWDQKFYREAELKHARLDACGVGVPGAGEAGAGPCEGFQPPGRAERDAGPLPVHRQRRSRAGRDSAHDRRVPCWRCDR